MMQTADRLRQRAWRSYLESTRTADDYADAEPEAWSRLQERLAEIDEELLHGLSAGSLMLFDGQGGGRARRGRRRPAAPGPAAARRCPGSCCCGWTPDAIGRLAAPLAVTTAGLGHQRQDDHRQDGGGGARAARPARCAATAAAPTSPPASPPRCSRPAGRGRAVRGRRGRADRRGRGARPERLVLGNLFRDQLDRYGELELIGERWRSHGRRRSRRRDGCRTTPTTRWSRRSAPRRRPRSRSASRTAALARATHAARRRLQVVRRGAAAGWATTPSLLGHLGHWRCPACGAERPQPAGARHRRSRRRPRGQRVPAGAAAAGTATVRLPVPGLYNVYNALAAAAIGLCPRRLRRPQIAERPRAVLGGVRRGSSGSTLDGRPAVLLLVKNPAGRERGDPHAGRRAGPQDAARGAERPDRRRPRRVVDLGRRLRGAGRRRSTQVVATGTRAAEMAHAAEVRRASTPPGIARGARSWRRRWTPGRPRATAPLYLLATYTAMLDLRRLLVDRGAGAAVLGGGVTLTRLPPLPRAPEHLRRPRQHGRARAPLRVAGHRLRGSIAAAPATRRPQADLYYLGGGQDRDQRLIVPDLLRPGRRPGRRPSPTAPACSACAAATSCSATSTAGTRATRCRASAWSTSRPSAGPTRMIGNVVLRCELEPGRRRTLVGFENHAGRTTARPGRRSRSATVVQRPRQQRRGRRRGRPARPRLGTYVHGPLLPKNPWLADWLIADALEPPGPSVELEPLDDTLEREAQRVAEALAARSRSIRSASAPTRNDRRIEPVPRPPPRPGFRSHGRSRPG